MLELYFDDTGQFEWLYSHCKFSDIMVIEVQGNQTQPGLVCLNIGAKSVYYGQYVNLWIIMHYTDLRIQKINFAICKN